MTKYCPNCVEPLILNTKKLGKGSTKWLVCKSCGLRVKANSTYYDNQEFDEFMKTKDIINLNERTDES